MNTAPQPSERSAPFGCASALAIGVLTVATGTGTFSLLTGRPLDLEDEWAVFLFQAFLAAAPFGLLALVGVADRLPWLVGSILTAMFWGYYYFDGIRYQLSGDKSGTNIGLGLLMLVSPIVICAACFLVYGQRRKRF